MANAVELIAKLTWIGAEGTLDGYPVFYRARRIPALVTYRESLEYLLVITYAYDIRSDDWTGLPSNSQYDTIAEFERRVIDELERSGIGALAFTRTSHGSVRYFAYTQSIEGATAILDRVLAEHDPVEFASEDDSKWQQYERFEAGLTWGESEAR